MSENKPRRKLAAILAADVVGFSKMMGENEDRTLENLKACRVITDESITTNHGRIFGSAGDSIIAEFASPVDAVIAATDFQRSLKLRNEEVLEENRVIFRVGLNLGDVIIEGDNLYGDGINIASRLEAMADPGGISLSGKFHDEVCRKLDMSFVATGDQEMKNIQNPVPTYKIEVSELSKIREESSFKIINQNNPDPAKDRSLENKPPSVAVLPFKNLSNDAEQDFFVDGITEDIITNLALWRNFPVISRNSAFFYKDKNLSMKEMAEELGAKYLIEGSVRKGGERLRISAQLVDAEKDQEIWNQKWDRKLEDIFDIQDELSITIAAQINPTLESYENEKINQSKPKDFNAWESYIKALQIYNNRNRDEIEIAKEYCNQAIEKDKFMSRAYSMLAQITMWELIEYPSEDSNQKLNNLKKFSKYSEELDRKNPNAPAMLCCYHIFQGDFEQAKTYSDRSINLNPSYPDAHMYYGHALVHSGEYEKSKEHFYKAKELNPLDPKSIEYLAGITIADIGLGLFEDALKINEQCIEQFPDTVFYLGLKASILGHLNRAIESNKYLKQYLNLRPNLKTRSDYKKMFIPNSVLADTIIDGLIKAGWKPED